VVESLGTFTNRVAGLGQVDFHLSPSQSSHLIALVTQGLEGAFQPRLERIRELAAAPGATLSPHARECADARAFESRLRAAQRAAQQPLSQPREASNHGAFKGKGSPGRGGGKGGKGTAVETRQVPTEPPLAAAAKEEAAPTSASETAATSLPPRTEALAGAGASGRKQAYRGPPFGRTAQSYITCFRQEGCFAQCNHSRWVRLDLQAALVDQEGHDRCQDCQPHDALTTCEDAGCLAEIHKWARTHLQRESVPLQGCWSLCSPHSRAVALVGNLSSEISSKHRVCSAPVCWLTAARDGFLPPVDTGVFAHRPDLSIYRTLVKIANDSPETNSQGPSEESSADIAASVSKHLDLQGRPLAVVIGGGYNNRTDGYPAQLWRSGFVVVNLDPCNDGRHSVGLR
jgi:hypothetical protein